MCARLGARQTSDTLDQRVLVPSCKQDGKVTIARFEALSSLTRSAA